MSLWCYGKAVFSFSNTFKTSAISIELNCICLCSVQGLILKFAVYVGLLDDLKRKANAVLHLMSEKLNGHTL